MRERLGESVCVCARERDQIEDTGVERVCACVFERERECVCVRERDLIEYKDINSHTRAAEPGVCEREGVCVRECVLVCVWCE